MPLDCRPNWFYLGLKFDEHRPHFACANKSYFSHRAELQSGHQVFGGPSSKWQPGASFHVPIPRISTINGRSNAVPKNRVPQS